MSPGLISIPIEVLYQVIERHGLTKADLKNLRLVHSSLSKLLAARVLREIGFKFGPYSRRFDAVDSVRIDRLLAVEDFAYSEVAVHAKSLFLSIPKNSPILIGAFPQTMEAMLPELLGTFRNLQAIEFEMNTRQYEPTFDIAPRLIGLICKHSVGKVLSMELSNLGSSNGYRLRPPTLAYPLKFVSALSIFRISANLGHIYTSLKPLFKEIRRIIKTSPNLSELGLDGLHTHRVNNPLDSIFDPIRPKDMPPIKKLTTQVTGGWGNPIVFLDRKNLLKFNNLEVLEMKGYHDESVWGDIHAATANIKLQRLEAGTMNLKLFNCLSNPTFTASLQVLKLDLPLDRFLMAFLGYGHGTNVPDEQSCTDIGRALYHHVIPNIHRNIRELTLFYRGYIHKTMNYHAARAQTMAQPIPAHVTKGYSSVAKHFSFLNGNNNRGFPSLTKLRAYILYDEAGLVIDSFITAIKAAPKLKDIHLLVEVADGGEFNSRKQNTIKHVFEEIEDIVCAELGVDWKAGGLVMEVKAAHLNSRKQKTSSFIFSGNGWVKR